MKKLIALGHRRTIAAVDEPTLALLAELQPNAASALHLDLPALGDLREALQRRRHARLQQELRDEVAQARGSELTALLRLPSLAPDLGEDAVRDALLETLRPHLAALEAPVSEALLAAAGGRGEPDTLRTLDLPIRRQAIAALLAAAPDESAWSPPVVVRQHGVAWTSQLGSEPETPEGAYRSALEATTALCLEGVRLLLVTAPAELQGFGALEEVLVNARAEHIATLFDHHAVDHAEDKRVDADLSLLGAYLEAHGETEVAAVSGAATHVLTVELRAGRKLVVRDFVTSDPYAVVELDDPALMPRQVRRSRTVRNTTRPKWGERWRFATTQQSTLRLRVVDQDRLSEDDPMGELAVAVWDLPVGEPSEAWYVLTGVDKGEVELALLVEPML